MDEANMASCSTARGRLVENHDSMIVLGLDGTDYQLYLAVASPVGEKIGKSVAGRILARAKRVDVVCTGGRYIEPIYGRPRRLQGRIMQLDPATNALTVQTACPFVCELTVGQRTSDFDVSQLVAFDIESSVRFEPMN